MVDRSLESSLESLAADRGITICFADLEGADGLWLPEERTILLARGLSSKQAADVLEHELSHVDIEDGHAVLDAAMHRHVGRTRWAVAGTAAASLALLLGIRAHLDTRPAADSHPVPPVAVATTHTSARPSVTTTPSTRVILVDGRVRTQTVTVTPPSPSGTPTGTPANTRAVLDRTPTATPKSGGVAPATTTSPPGVAGGGITTTTPPVTTTTPPIDTGEPTPTGAGGPTGAAISAGRQR